MTHTHPHGAGGDYSRAFGVGIGLNLVFVVIEAAVGLVSGSMALLSDAGHNLSDVLALALAWGGFRLARSKPTQRRTYGMKRATIFASLLSAVLLCVALGAVIWEAISRFGDPVPLNGLTIVVVATIGVVINSITAVMFMSGRDRDLNIKGAFLHMVADAAVSLGVVIAGITIYMTGWLWMDPTMALVIAAAILFSAVGLLRESLELAMDVVPQKIDAEAVSRYLSALPGVADIHDLHIWAMSTTETALTVHLVIPDAHVEDAFLQSVSETLQDRFNVEHPTIQIESGVSDESCASSKLACSSPPGAG